MPKLVYLYTSGGAPRGDMNNIPLWSPLTTDNRFAMAAPSDGMVNMFKLLTEKHALDKLTVIIDSTISPGVGRFGYKSHIHVLPSMTCAKHFIAPGDILVVRGGFKSWIPFLDYIYQRRENWILFYRANTNRHAWPYWDITLNDLIPSSKAIRKRLHYNFSKPVDEGVFGCIDAPGTLPREYDVMIGASHIHRKKGQHLTVQALQRYYHLFGTKPKAILPGGYMRSWTTGVIQSILRSGDVDIEGPRGIPRAQLALAMNRSKLFVHAGYGGQNDRGILEAMACGCLPLLFGQSHMSPVIWDNSVHIPQGPTEIAHCIHAALNRQSSTINSTISKVYHRINGLHEVAIPKFQALLDFINQHPTPDRAAACDRFASLGSPNKEQSQCTT